MDPLERASQLQLMGKIYANAATVAVWLSESEFMVDSFNWMHGEFFSALDTYANEHGEIESLQKYRIQDPQFHALLGLQVSGDEMVNRFSEYARFFFSRRWFSRSWVVQEVALANNVVFICGSHAWDWNQIRTLSRIMNLTQWTVGMLANGLYETGFGNETAHTVAVGSDIQVLDSAAAAFSTPGRSAETNPWVDTVATLSGPCSDENLWFSCLLYLVISIRDNVASDPRDKIYCVLGMANMFLNEMEAPIQPSYQNSVHDVYVSFAACLVRKAPRLLLLSAVEVERKDNSHSLPSWVPDWTVRHNGMQLAHLSFGRAYDASLSLTRAETTCAEVDGNTLIVRGAQFDVIVQTTPPVSKWWQANWRQLPLLGFCLECEAIYPPTGQPRIEAVWRTLIGDVSARYLHSGAVYPAPETFAAGFCSWVRFKLAEILNNLDPDSLPYLEFVEILDRSDVSFQQGILSETFPSKHEVFAYAKLLHDYNAAKAANVPEDETKEMVPKIDEGRGDFTASLNTMVNRTMYRTSRGYIGISPESAQSGDLICILDGAMVPFVFRKTDHGYRIVGETYLHGFMRGEMLTDEVVSSLGEMRIV